MSDATDGTGTFTITSAKTINTGNGALFITAADVDITDSPPNHAGITAGTSTVLILGSQPSQDIGLGRGAINQRLTSPQPLIISNVELGQITSSGGLTFGNSDSGDIIVSGIYNADTDMNNPILLKATKATKKIKFTGIPSTFNKGITVTANGGIDVVDGGDLVYYASTTTLNCGTGQALTIRDASLITNDQEVDIVSDKINLETNGFIKMGTATLKLQPLTLGSIGVGANTTGDLLGSSISQETNCKGSPAQGGC